MSTDPRIERPNLDQADAQRRDDERETREDRDTDPNPAFQKVADDIGERFREALDKLS